MLSAEESNCFDELGTFGAALGVLGDTGCGFGAITKTQNESK